jgi:hypothetical protein
VSRIGLSLSLVVYLDESGITDAAACVVAGYAAPPVPWSSFSIRWQRLLRERSIDEFHAKRFFARDKRGGMVGEYKGWSEAAAGSFLNELLEILGNAEPLLVGTSIAVADFLALSEAKRRYLTGGTYYVKARKVRGGAAKTPFHIAMQNTVIQAAKLAPAGEPADFVCDAQKQYSAYAVERFNLIKAKHRNLPLGTICHVSSSESAPVQAADLACYAAFQFTKQRLKTGDMLASGLLQRLVGEKDRFDFLDKTKLTDLAKDISEDRQMAACPPIL